MIELVRAGNPAPSAEAVSRQADVSLRTVFRHFDDMDSLYQEMSAVVEAEILPFWSEPLPQAPWPDLLTETRCPARARVRAHHALQARGQPAPPSVGASRASASRHECDPAAGP